MTDPVFQFQAVSVNIARKMIETCAELLTCGRPCASRSWRKSPRPISEILRTHSTLHASIYFRSLAFNLFIPLWVNLSSYHFYSSIAETSVLGGYVINIRLGDGDP